MIAVPGRLVSALLTSALLLAAGCSDRGSRDVMMDEEGTRTPDQIIKGFSITITDEGVKKTRVEADEAFVFEEEDLVAARKLDVVFYGENGEYFSRLRSDSGTIDMKTNDMVAVGNVVVVTDDGTRLETGSLVWDDDEEKISTDDSVVIYQEDKVLRGKGLVSDPKLEDVLIMEPTGRFKEKERADKD